MTPPLILLGVSRSGTTLLRVILDRSPGLAIPDESFFVPLLARRHRGPVQPRRFLDDVRRIPTI
ncbi:MAG TPA: sulfotransferase, partial [Gaiellaceae bacterium]|nr:sulfotransferase [Gaiellaceae bacterium]